MKNKSLVLGSILMATAAASMSGAQATKFKLVLAQGSSCDLAMVQLLDLEPSAQAIVMAGDSSPAFLQYSTALFNPKEYTLARGASIMTVDPAGRSSHSMTVPPAESLRAIWAGATSLVGSGGNGRRGFASNEVHHNGISQIIADEMVPFFASDDSSMVRLPPAVSGGVPVDPIGHILCALKTRTKSNQTNERTYSIPEMTDEIASQNVRILLQGGDGKGEMVVAPITMGAMKLTKADAGRALDATVAPKKIQSWVKDCYDRHIAPFDPSLTNVLQFDCPTAEAERIMTRFPAGQGMRIKVKFPWLCDADCAMTQPLSSGWVQPISATTSRVSIVLIPEMCRLLPTVNK